MKLANQRVGMTTLLLALMADRLGLLVWSKTKDGQKGRNQPRSLVDSLSNVAKEPETMVFESSEEFEKMKNEIIEGGG
ncbi:DUF5361 domain-containing protein [Gemella morbillorum]|uniref:DUF5361 domain-containing protein n=1 Tax=Gemella morbillorum TaxID=29391 RepID=UPI00248E39A5|nr:DUF5361 domain-containing protein [Gemella morbillorum]